MRTMILGLARPMLRLLGHDDRGAVAVLVGVLIGGGVLLGMGAMVLDVGRLYQERAELQNGAGAAALAVAGSCANGTCAPASVAPVAAGIANKNASNLTGHQEKVDWVCGSAGLGTCPSTTTGSITNCPPPPSSLPKGANWVDVHTSTHMPSGSTLLPPALGRALLGNGSYQGTDVAACAQAIWGPAQQSNSLALTLSLCVWQDLTGDTDFTSDLSENSDLMTDPDEGTAADNDSDTDTDTDTTSDTDNTPTGPVAVYIKGKAKQCAGPAGDNLAGGFDWLNTDTDNDGETTSDTDNDNDASNTCNAFIDLTTNTSYNNTGNNVSSACKTALYNDVKDGTPVFLPIFDAVSGTGNNATYAVIGLAGFTITGYKNMPGMTDYGVPNPSGYSLCGTSSSVSGNNAPCIEGTFQQGLDPVGSVGSSDDFGATAVQLTG